MNIEKQLNYLFRLERPGMKYDLKNIERLCVALGNPQNNFKSIHIAGTNGKGSTSVYTQSLLTTAGFRTGLFISPHVLKFNERISIDYKLIDDNYISEYISRYKELFNEIKPSFFEATTALAFKFFSDSKVDYAVIEAGLGGRLDSTNIINPEITCITTIGYDHMDYLGDTIEKISFEKAGIIKKNVPCIVGKMPVEALNVLKNVCNDKSSELILAENIDVNLNTPLDISTHQLMNLKKSCSIVKQMGIDLPDINLSYIRAGNNEAFRGRFEIINNDPLIIADVAHNVQALENLAHSLERVKYKKLYIIFGMMHDKDIATCAQEVENYGAEKIILSKANSPRAQLPVKLMTKFSQHEKIILSDNVTEAFQTARKFVKTGDLLLVTGSFYLCGDFLDTLSKFKF